MKFKKSIALILIFSIILSSVGFYNLEYSQNQTAFKNSQLSSSTQLLADSQDTSDELLESLKTNLSSKVNSEIKGINCVLSESAFKSVRFARNNAFLRKLLTRQSTIKSFLVYGSLII